MNASISAGGDSRWRRAWKSARLASASLTGPSGPSPGAFVVEPAAALDPAQQVRRRSRRTPASAAPRPAPPGRMGPRSPAGRPAGRAPPGSPAPACPLSTPVRHAGLLQRALQRAAGGCATAAGCRCRGSWLAAVPARPSSRAIADQPALLDGGCEPRLASASASAWAASAAVPVDLSADAVHAAADVQPSNGSSCAASGT